MISHLIKTFKLYLINQKQRSLNTAQNYIRDIEQFIEAINPPNVSSVDGPCIEQYLLFLNQRQLSNKSIYRKITALDQFWRFLISEQHVTSNPWERIKRPKMSQSLPTYLDAPVVLELLDNYPTERHEDIRNKAILELLFASGIRVSELINIHLDDIDYLSQECRITGKGDKDRVALLKKRASHAISQYISLVRPHWQQPKTNALFISKSGQALTTRTIQRIVKAANQFHSSPIEITPHACRHTCASLMIANGAGIRDIQEFLGHSSISTTERYTHIPTEALRQKFLSAMDGNIAEST